MADITIINIDKNNIAHYPPTCFLNPNNEGYQIKYEWLEKRFSEGLKIKLLYVENEGKCNGFIEYVPGEYAWRAVDAPGYLFIHCIWINPNKYKNKGYGTRLIEECITDAKKDGKYGVAVVASEGSFMASKDIFLKNGFTSVATVKPFDLMVKTLQEGPLPKFKDWEKQLSTYQGLHIIYSNQCPWVARSIKELDEIANDNGLDLEITELQTAQQAQDGPSIYAVFNLIYNGKLLADHYISSKRFQNIIDKEIK
jgi:ribosomal protein S18 acetylase RimI-like enzyme